ncbi:N-acetyltransferase [Xenorhabdus mauleonii]|uniref:N-acetyltransferase n=1 Tax=Xenorhabdus mauleonii TaxID=351675 RepID=A0A1I3VNZ7_9GAMM|nr:GNAT family N-acetyltransferase [Xenorhabdus mauleonii]PHM37408.1 N-acetyltransferase [Xenorhabdus mauleonii]SFJ95977.1 hypothetical protein SAMN05421680_12155 [Xenorhabdus mauleonii]
MFRSKSFDMHRPIGFGSLSRACSMPNIKITMHDARMSLVVKEVDKNKAQKNVSTILYENMLNKDWLYEETSEPPDSFQQKWNDRYDESRRALVNILEEISRDIRPRQKLEKDILYFIAYFRGVPVGALLLYADGGSKGASSIEHMATHSGIRGCGVLLIEAAINKLLQLGMSGKVRTIASTNENARAYINMGFRHIDQYELILRPAKRNDKWNFIDGHYKYIGC